MRLALCLDAPVHQGGFMSDRHLDRRAFNVAWAYALLGGAAITVTGCGSDSPAAPTPSPSGGPAPAPAPTVTDKEGNVSDNHGHRAVITAAQLTAGGALELNIRDTGTHGHTISLTDTQVVSVRNGARV